MLSLRLLRPTRRRLLILGGCVGFLAALWLSLSLLLVYLLTRRPHAPFAEPAPVVVWASFEEHRLRTGDGEELGAWFHRGAAGRPSVLVLHGNRGCRRDGLPAASVTEEGSSDRRASCMAALPGEKRGRVSLACVW
jgi:hypothetical protein